MMPVLVLRASEQQQQAARPKGKKMFPYLNSLAEGTLVPLKQRRKISS